MERIDKEPACVCVGHGADVTGYLVESRFIWGTESYAIKGYLQFGKVKGIMGACTKPKKGGEANFHSLDSSRLSGMTWRIRLMSLDMVWCIPAGRVTLTIVWVLFELCQLISTGLNRRNMVGWLFWTLALRAVRIWIFICSCFLFVYEVHLEKTYIWIWYGLKSYLTSHRNTILGNGWGLFFRHRV